MKDYLPFAADKGSSVPLVCVDLEVGFEPANSISVYRKLLP